MSTAQRIVPFGWLVHERGASQHVVSPSRRDCTLQLSFNTKVKNSFTFLDRSFHHQIMS